jgi:hypothetical protein
MTVVTVLTWGFGQPREAVLDRWSPWRMAR